MWTSPDDLFQAQADRREAEEARDRQRRLALVRIKTEREFGPPPKDDEHRLDIQASVPRGGKYAGRTWYRGDCTCGWRARQSAPTEAWAERDWKRHMTRILDPGSQGRIRV